MPQKKSQVRAAQVVKRKNGRPRFEFNMELVENLAKIQCTDMEIAAVCGCSIETVKRRKKDDAEFCATILNGKEQGKSSLRRIQFGIAQGGNAGMAIWLGKQYLGQKEDPVTQVNVLNVDTTTALDRLNRELARYVGSGRTSENSEKGRVNGRSDRSPQV